MKQPEASYAERFGERLRAELLLLAVREGKPVGWSELGRRVKDATGREVTAASVNRWGAGSVPDLETIAALAAILGLRAGYLAFGEEPRLPSETSTEPDVQGAVRHSHAARKAASDRKRRPKQG